MQKLSYLIVFIVLAITGYAQSPHGAAFKIDCAACHTSKTWKVTKSAMSFDHNTTHFKLTGQHQVVDCSSCHKTLKFQEAKSECKACHTDLHRNTLGPDCARCHDTNAWIIKNTKTMHLLSRFPLQGNHAVLECSACHKSSSNLQFEPLGIECMDCHKKDYLATTAPNHQKSGYPTNCIECHGVTATGWTKTSFNHESFPITNGHNVSCVDCHKDGSYQKLNTECVSCHQVQYNGAKGHVASKFSTDCKPCHTITRWPDATFNHAQTNFPLTGAHVTTSCTSCHATSYAGTSMECKSCHQTNFNNAQTPNHTKAGIPVDCKTCHTTTTWKPSTFNHSTTIFPLTGGHAAIVQCSDCHLGSTTTAKPECISCHQVQYNNAKDHVASKFPTDCKMCHNSTNWLNATFNHSATNFPLTGAHLTVICASCHSSGYIGTSTECKSCHQAKYTSTQTPKHTAAGISVDCKTCHTSTAWQPSSFNHSTTGFTLSGGHAAIVQCSDCHLGSTTIAKPECISCHQVQYNTAKNHVASKFPTDCKMCHNSTNWLNATFNHSATNFPLTGAHVTVICASCHSAGYAGTSTECKSCHQAKYTSAQTPNHTAAGIPVDCKTCHTSIAWQPSSFNHSTTIFPLTGAHTAIVQCSDCHLGSTTTTSPECVSCHQVQYNNAKGHVASKFPTDCKICHTTTNWLGATFNHSSTNFPLTGAHVPVDCATCHTTGYVGTSMECKSCHQAKYTSAVIPNHTKAGIPVECKTCHTTTAWQPSTFNHSTTIFPLTGAHTTIVQCSDCHLGSTTTTSPDCVSCHQAQYNTAKDHLASKFPTDCKLCHNSVNWLQSTFNHATTNFPLTGAHVSATCISCHATGYVGTSTACNSCHLTNYNATTNPNHNTLGLSVNCTDCHTTVPGWKPASFAIHGNYYPLNGGHAVIANDCAACHKGVYPNTTKVCYNCHTTTYNNTTNPAHKTAQFSTDCASCHTVNAWVPSTFNHTAYFPISTGKHTNISCSICHTNTTNYTVFTCVTAACHSKAHNQNQGSAGCYKCHPTGRE